MNRMKEGHGYWDGVDAGHAGHQEGRHRRNASHSSGDDENHGMGTGKDGHGGVDARHKDHRGCSLCQRMNPLEDGSVQRGAMRYLGDCEPTWRLERKADQ